MDETVELLTEKLDLLTNLKERMAALVASRAQVAAQLEQVKANLAAHNGAIEELERVLGLMGAEAQEGNHGQDARAPEE